jgi:hypothetical protein
MTVMVLLILFFSSAVYCAPVEGIVYSTLFPGWGQMKTGRYGRGTLFMGTEIIALTGIAIANIQYDREVEAFERSSQLFKIATYIGDIEYYNNQMKENWESADRTDTYRKVLVGAAIGIWAINLIDMIWGHNAEEIPISMEIKKSEFLITKSFRF